MKHPVLFAGGCHVNGYPFERERSFSNLVAESLCRRSIPAEAQSFGPFKLTRSEALSSEIRRVRPHYLVLQLGNYETSRTHRDWLSQTLTGRGHNRPASMAPLVSPFGTRASVMKWRARAWVKYVGDTVLGSPLVDPRRVREELMEMLRVSKGLMGEAMLLVGALPCADPTILRYRKRLVPVFCDVAGEVGVPFLEPIRAWMEQGRPFGVFHDSSHLSPAGHEWLAEQVSDFIVKGGLLVLAGDGRMGMAVGKLESGSGG